MHNLNHEMPFISSVSVPTTHNANLAVKTQMFIFFS